MAEHLRALMLKAGDRVVLRDRPGTVNQVVHAGNRVRVTVQVDGGSAITSTMTGETLVEMLTYQPRVGDSVQVWLEGWLRDLTNEHSQRVVASLLAEYTFYATVGVPLGTPVPEQAPRG